MWHAGTKRPTCVVQDERKRRVAQLRAAVFFALHVRGVATHRTFGASDPLSARR